MKTIRHFLALGLAALVMIVLSGTTVRAQLPSHVTWTATIDSLSATEGILRLTAGVEPGWHIYGTSMPSLPDDAGLPDPTTVTIDPVQGLSVDSATEVSVEATQHYDDIMKLNLPWLSGTFTISRRFRLDQGTSAAVIRGHVRYMACTENACTPPTSHEFALTFGSGTVATPAAPQDVTGAATAATDAAAMTTGWWEPVTMPVSGTSDMPDTADTSWWGILLFGFFGGLLALLTPCVWPMIPMTVSFFLKKSKSRSKSVGDAIIYALSIIVIYLILGIAITLIFGAGKLNEIATSAVFNLIFFGLLVVFAISFFGAFEITLPSRWSNAVDSKAESTTGIVSIFFMAFTLVLVSFSCTGPIIGTLLVEAASRGDILGPAVGMGGFALGLALPFGLFAFFPSMLKELPRSGSWLNTVKVVLGFVELILSLKFLSVADLAYGWRILDREIFLAIWIVLFILLGMYLLGKLRFSHDSPSEHTGVGRFFLAVVSLSFAVYLLPGMWGAPLKGISAFAPPLYTQDFNLYGGEFREFHDYDEGMAYASETGKPVLLDFSGYACVNCRKMEGAVFDTPEVRTIVEEDYVLIKLMVDDKTPLPSPLRVEEYGKTVTLRTVGDRWSYLQRHKFGINSQPYYVLLDGNGRPLAPARTYDENLEDFVMWLREPANKKATISISETR